MAPFWDQTGDADGSTAGNYFPPVEARRLDRFAQLPPEKQAEVKGLIVEANSFPPPRSGAVKQALYQLQKMNDIQREVTLQRPGFQARFSPEEFRVIQGLADAWMGPAQEWETW